MNIKYRKSKIEDLSFILDILNSVSGDVKHIRPEQFLIAEVENKIIGCIRIKNNNGNFMLASLAVVSDYRKNGVGSTLVKIILNENKIRPIYLFLNAKNQNFYKKFGFRKIRNEDLPKPLREDYNVLLKRNFSNNTNILIAMVLNK